MLFFLNIFFFIIIKHYKTRYTSFKGRKKKILWPIEYFFLYKIIVEHKNSLKVPIVFINTYLSN